jgi:hypothetical protein
MKYEHVVAPFPLDTGSRDGTVSGAPGGRPKTVESGIR